ncbi:hypothetical protein HMPREF1568_0132 [Providencia alcalifaciens PAL-3]|nr:hypothetical protein HMPREF1568_0132 [Providencia alcalifaciens PAL-3]EUD00833.1 hypothetical protein HMPREF1566_2721 [Providencia alcalifaciens PAL-1]
MKIRGAVIFSAKMRKQVLICVFSYINLLICLSLRGKL